MRVEKIPAPTVVNWYKNQNIKDLSIKDKKIYLKSLKLLKLYGRDKPKTIDIPINRITEGYKPKKGLLTRFLLLFNIYRKHVAKQDSSLTEEIIKLKSDLQKIKKITIEATTDNLTKTKKRIDGSIKEIAILEEKLGEIQGALARKDGLLDSSKRIINKEIDRLEDIITKLTRSGNKSKQEFRLAKQHQEGKEQELANITDEETAEAWLKAEMSQVSKQIKLLKENKDFRIKFKESIENDLKKLEAE